MRLGSVSGEGGWIVVSGHTGPSNAYRVVRPGGPGYGAAAVTSYRPQEKTGRQAVIGAVARLRDGRIRLVDGVLEVSNGRESGVSCCPPCGTLQSRTAF